jgi:hypothetical protein
MVIPLSQLQVWSTRPNPGRSADTYASVREALKTSRYLRDYAFDVYLQGSYANATNIRADSDVDIIAQLTSTFRSNVAALSSAERSRFDSYYSDGTHDYTEFRRDVLAALRAHYGSGTVSEGNKCVKIAGAGSRLNADLLVAQEYRKYQAFPSAAQERYIEGVIFRTRDGREVINYPKVHRSNGEAKHDRTGDRYKPLVRTVKNARRRLIEDGQLGQDAAPSYFVECLLYNVSDDRFTGDVQDTYYGVLNWLHEMRFLLSGPRCQNGIVDLFGPTPEQWNVYQARSFIDALVAQWDTW